MFRTGGNVGVSRQNRAGGEVRPTALGVPGVSVHESFRVPFGPAMNRRVVGSAGIPAGVLRADCHAGKDAGAPRFIGRSHVFPHMCTVMNAGCAVLAFGQTFNVQRSTLNVQPPRPLNVEC